MRNILRGVESRIEKAVKDVILDYAKRIYTEAMSNTTAEIASTYSFETTDNGYRVKIYTDNEMAAYIEFHTGRMSKAYLAGQPKEVGAEAIKFFKTGEGTLQGNPYLFPAFYKYRDQIIPAIDKAIQAIFDRL